MNKNDVTYEDIIEALKTIGVSQEMLDNPYFSEGEFERILNEYLIDNYPVIFSKLECDLQRNIVTLINEVDSTVFYIEKKEYGLDFSGTKKRYVSIPNSFTSYACTSTISFNSSNKFPLEIRDHRMHDSIFIDKETGRYKYYDDRHCYISSFDSDGIEYISDEFHKQMSPLFISHNNTTRDYINCSLDFFIDECAMNTSPNEKTKYGDFEHISKKRKFADVLSYKKYAKKNGQTEIEEHNNIIYSEQLHTLWTFSPYSVEDRIIGPEDELQLMNEIEQVHATDRIKKRLQKYVAGRSEYCSEDYLKQQEKTKQM